MTVPDDGDEPAPHREAPWGVPGGAEPALIHPEPQWGVPRDAEPPQRSRLSFILWVVLTIIVILSLVLPYILPYFYPRRMPDRDGLQAAILYFTLVPTLCVGTFHTRSAGLPAVARLPSHAERGSEYIY